MTARQTRARVDDDIRAALQRLLSLSGGREMCCSRDLARGFSLLTSAWLPVTAPSWRRCERGCQLTYLRVAHQRDGCASACGLRSLLGGSPQACFSNSLVALQHLAQRPFDAREKYTFRCVALCLIWLVRGSPPGLCESSKPPPEQAPYGQHSCWFCRLTDVPPRAPSAWRTRCGHGGPHQPQPGGV